MGGGVSRLDGNISQTLGQEIEYLKTVSSGGLVVVVEMSPLGLQGVSRSNSGTLVTVRVID